MRYKKIAYIISSCLSITHVCYNNASDKKLELISETALEKIEQPAQENIKESITPESITDEMAFLTAHNALPENRLEFGSTKNNPSWEFGPILRLINDGNQVIKNIYAGQQYQITADPTSRLEYLKAIIALSWALFAKAVKKGQGFISGVLVLEDPGYKIYDFLYNYTKSVNPNADQESSGLKNMLKRAFSPKWAAVNPYAYRRSSSHFNDAGLVQFGIDMRDTDNVTKDWLPGKKRHLLFGKTGRLGPIFIKFEDYGLVGTDWLGHAAKYVQKNVLPKGPGKREHVPEEVTKRFKSLLTKVPETRKKQLNANNAKFIKDIYVTVQQLAKDPRNATYYTDAQEFVKYLQNNFDNLDMRRGNEVIIRALELKTP